MSDASFDSTKKSLKAILEAVGDGKTQLPDFQRGWVWDDDHIRDLLASVSKAFPIGAVMLLQGGGEARFKTRMVEGVTAAARDAEHLILDGQQRITSLYQSLISTDAVATRDAKKKEIKRRYYVDMAGSLDPTSDRLDAIVSIPADRKVRSDFGRVIDLDLSAPEGEYQACLFPVTQMFDAANWRRGFNKYWEDDPSKSPFYDRFELEVIERFKQYQLPYIELSSDTPKEAVCLVFEKVNTGGVSLSVFELLTATFAADNFQLRDDWAARKSQLDEVKVLEGVTNTDFLMALSLVATDAERTEALKVRADGDGVPQVTCKRRDILRLTLDQYREHADSVVKGFTDAAKFLVTQSVFETKFLPYQSQLVPLAALFAKMGSELESERASSLLARWYWSGVFGELYGSTVETLFARDMLEVPTWIEGGKLPRTLIDANFAPERLLSLRTRGSAAYKGIYVLLLKEGAKDFRTGEPSSLHNYFDTAVDIHHIFPKKWCLGQTPPIDVKVFDSVVNKTPLTATTNRMIGGVAPSEYIAKLEKSDAVNLDDSLGSHLIDPPLLRSDDFEQFFERRQAELLAKVETAMGKQSISEPSEADIVDDFVEVA